MCTRDSGSSSLKEKGEGGREQWHLQEMDSLGHCRMSSQRPGGRGKHPNLPETTALKTHEQGQAARSHPGNECPHWDFTSDLAYFKALSPVLWKEAIWSTPCPVHTLTFASTWNRQATGREASCVCQHCPCFPITLKPYFYLKTHPIVHQMLLNYQRCL